MSCHAYLLVLKKQQNVKLLSAANYRWRFMGYKSLARDSFVDHFFLFMFRVCHTFLSAS